MATKAASPDPKFTIRFDPAEDILHMRLDGFWSMATLAAYTARLLMETGGLRMRGKRYGILSDSRTFAVQSAEVTAGFDALSKKGAEHHKGKTAIVVASTLNKMQAERALASDRVRVFLDMDEARNWLMADRERTAA